jgi:hypothetical protein
MYPPGGQLPPGIPVEQQLDYASIFVTWVDCTEELINATRDCIILVLKALYGYVTALVAIFAYARDLFKLWLVPLGHFVSASADVLEAGLIYLAIEVKLMQKLHNFYLHTNQQWGSVVSGGEMP